MMQEEHIPYHTFPLTTMSIDELESCATRPFRIHAGLLQDRLAQLSPCVFRLDYSSFEAGGWKHANCPPYLVPGGRWLLSLAHCVRDETPPRVALFCWDLTSVRDTSGVTVIPSVSNFQLNDLPSMGHAYPGITDIDITVQSVSLNQINILVSCTVQVMDMEL